MSNDRIVFFTQLYGSGLNWFDNGIKPIFHNEFCLFDQIAETGLPKPDKSLIVLHCQIGPSVTGVID